MALVPCQVLRVAILLSYCSILCNYKAIEMPSHQTYGGSWKFLTFIDLVLARTSTVGSSCNRRELGIAKLVGTASERTKIFLIKKRKHLIKSSLRLFFPIVSDLLPNSSHRPQTTGERDFQTASL
ncbi:androgen-induced gene 1 protein isoform X3 [Talpa occidentalis]|uniref:androgen-induced gene 1 protein isoform X3 n=1 Tax=Talpa occidentalis TaxID=50954 RepID=UPI00188E6C91|nr:androgen-induced gene 1 protein isoform X3 [Talpa occidentalis]